MADPWRPPNYNGVTRLGIRPRGLTGARDGAHTCRASHPPSRL